MYYERIYPQINGMEQMFYVLCGNYCIRTLDWPRLEYFATRTFDFDS